LDNAIRCLSKKSKMNVLERTQQDWQEFKNGEELDNHNRGKCGYIDRMAFLNRADLRTFELERNARNSSPIDSG
uniref:Craniofacial development protein 1 n=1 Tax=Dracunculus medinensis TaxID=318479 RepID=A0A0N4U753_DRAME